MLRVEMVHLKLLMGFYHKCLDKDVYLDAWIF